MFIKVAVFILFALTAVWQTHTFEIGSYEALEIHEADVPFWQYVSLESARESYADRGPVFPALLRQFKSIVGLDIIKLRYLPLFFLLAGLGLFLFYPLPAGRDSHTVIAGLLLVSNYHFLLNGTFLKPYALLFLLSLVVFYFYERSYHEPLRDKFFWAFGLVGALSIFTFFTSALPVFICLSILCARRARVSLNTFLVAGVLLVATLPKFYMIYVFRFGVRKGDSSYTNLGQWETVQLLSELFGFSQNYWALIVLFAVLGIAVYFSRSQSLRLLVAAYLVLTVVSVVVLKAMDLHEIVPRYYLALLPLVYLMTASVDRSWAKAMLGLLVVLNLTFFFGQVQNHRPRPVESVALYLKNELRPGDLVCTPQINGQTEKLDQTLRYYLGIQKIADQNTADYFACRKIFAARTTIEAPRLWLISYGKPFDAASNCSPMVDVFDCNAEYYRSTLQAYDPVHTQTIVKDRHAQAFITLHQRR